MFLALMLFDQGVEVDFMAEMELLKGLRKPDSKEGKQFWNDIMPGLDAIIGGSEEPE